MIIYYFLLALLIILLVEITRNLTMLIIAKKMLFQFILIPIMNSCNTELLFKKSVF